jgi:hypothetical protein
VVLRDKDANTAWTAAADSIDERRYYCQNWRAVVSAVINSDGSQVGFSTMGQWNTPRPGPGAARKVAEECRTPVNAACQAAGCREMAAPHSGHTPAAIPARS